MKKDTLKQLILEAAEHIILKEGYQNLSARKIAARAGCSVGSLYNAYQNLNDIVLSVNQRTLNRLHDKFKKCVLKSTASPSEVLLALGGIYMKFWELEYPLANTLFNYAQPEKKALPEWAQKDIEALFLTLTGVITPIKEALREPPETVAVILWAGLHGIATLYFTGKIKIIATESHECLTRSFISNYLSGCLK